MGPEVVPVSLSLITLYCDNSGAVAQSKEPSIILAFLVYI